MSRTAHPRFWRTLTLTGTAVGVAAAGALKADTGYIHPGEAKLWLSQSDGGEGGEGGEGGAPAGTAPGTAFLIELGKLEAHLLAAVRLYDAGAVDDAVALASHPEAEFMEELREKLDKRGIEDITPRVDALVEALATGDGITEAEAAVVSDIRAAAGGIDAAERYDAILHLVRSSAAEYGHGIENGEVVDPVAVEESRGFLNAARSLVEQEADGKAGEKTLALIDEASIVFPGAVSGGFTADPSILHAAAARIEFATAGLR